MAEEKQKDRVKNDYLIQRFYILRILGSFSSLLSEVKIKMEGNMFQFIYFTEII